MKNNDILAASKNYTIIDVATTGFRPEIDSPVEVSAIKIKNGILIDKKTWKINPEVSIPPAATAHHEITDEDVIGCPILSEVTEDIKSFVGSDTIVMHNLSPGEGLDYYMLPFLHDNEWICSARLSKHIWPQMTENNGFPLANYDVWTLLYWLDIKNIDTFGAQVYETLANSVAAAAVFDRALDKYLDINPNGTIEDLKFFTEQPVSFPLMPRGPFKNCYMKDLPDQYMQSLIAKIRDNPDKSDKDYIHTIEQEMSLRLSQKFNHSGGLRKF